VNAVDPHRDPERLEDDLAAYALGALTTDEAADLERHVTGCRACIARLLWLQPAVDVLPASVEQRTPSERLRENLMEVVRGEAAAQAQAERATEHRPSWWESLRGFAMRPATAMAVAIVLVAGIGVGYLVRGNDVVEPESTLVKAQALDSGVPVSATLERVGDSATLHVTQMPELSSDDVYEVWVQRANVMEPRSTFVLNSDGSAEAAVPGPLNGADAVLVTREPRGGSQQPTTKPLLSAPL
jgi:anti-sigma-K factor RskA